MNNEEKQLWETYAGLAIMGCGGNVVQGEGKELAKRSFDIADEMIRERKKRLKQLEEKRGRGA